MAGTSLRSAQRSAHHVAGPARARRGGAGRARAPDRGDRRSARAAGAHAHALRALERVAAADVRCVLFEYK